jgi:hypothetical protein
LYPCSPRSVLPDLISKDSIEAKALLAKAIKIKVEFEWSITAKDKHRRKFKQNLWRSIDFSFVCLLTSK